MRPDLTGQSKGTEIVKAIIEFGQKQHGFKELFLLGAKFNKSAIRVCEKLGCEK